MNRSRILPIAILIGALLLTSAGRARAEDMVLRRYIDLALARNPRVSAAEHRTNAATERISQAGALADPMLGLGLSEYPLGGPGTDRLRMAAKRISIEQQFPWPGSRRLERGMAGADRDMLRAMTDAERVMLALEVKMSYREWQRIRAELVLIDSSRAVLTKMLAQTRSNYAVGLGDLSDLLRAETEVNKLDAMRVDFAAMEQKVVADLSTFCQLPPDSISTPPQPLEFQPRDYEVDSVLARVSAASPELRAAEFKHRAAEIGVKSARKMGLPMFSLGLEYMRRHTEVMTTDGHTVETELLPDNMISIMGGATLPVYRKSKQNRLVAQREIAALQAGDERDVIYNDLRLGVSKALADLQALDEQIGLYQTAILPQARTTLAAALIGYANGRVDFTALLSSEMNVFEQERQAVAKIAEFAIARARLEAATGEVYDER
ncbi:TolC family protein [candidate division KSB1 bacterium]|nr:TolC family protein [candidate division KSB1 bacterium]